MITNTQIVPITFLTKQSSMWIATSIATIDSWHTLLSFHSVLFVFVLRPNGGVDGLEEEERAHQEDDKAGGGDGDAHRPQLRVGLQGEPQHQAEADEQRAQQGGDLGNVVGIVVGEAAGVLLRRHT